MIISDHKKFFFIHNPKSAGTSLRRDLFQYDTNPFRFEYQRYVPGLERSIELFHVCAADWKAVWPDRDFGTYFKFGFVRDPYTRLFSSWDEFRRQHKYEGDDFNAWLRTNLTPANVRYDWKYTHFCPQHYFFYSGVFCRADFIGRFENLGRDWATICQMVKIPIHGLDKHKDHKTYKLGDRQSINDLDEDVLEQVNRVYWMDFKLFGYEMKGPIPEFKEHQQFIDSVTSPMIPYNASQDPRLLPVTDQCAYWREKAATQEARAEHLLKLYNPSGDCV